MSARHGRKPKDHAAPEPPGAAEDPSASAAPDDEIEILEVVGVNETERDAEPVPDVEPVSGPAAPAVDVEALERELVEARREKDRCHDLWLRSQADLENFRKRTEREAEQRRDTDAARLVGRMLPVLDNLERALRARGEAADPLWSGVALVHQQMLDLLGREGLVAVESVGRPFDPRHHEAVEMVPAPAAAAGSVIEEMQKGYLFRDRLIRPALVRVAAGPEGGEGRGGEGGEGR